MKNTVTIKRVMLICFCILFLYEGLSFADEIEKIKSLYADINKIIDSGATKEMLLELTSKGWEKSGKISTKLEGDLDLMENAKAYLMNGRLLKSIIIRASPSGDWESISDYYFYENGKTAFIFESYLTYQGFDFDKGEDLSPGPYIIEKRIYLNDKGQEIKILKKSFIKSSKKEVQVKYLKKNEFDIYADAKSLPFYKLLH